MSFCHRLLHCWEKTIFHNLFSFSVIPLSQVFPLLPSSHVANHFCTNWFGNLQEIISAAQRTFPIMSPLPTFLPSFYLSALRAIKRPMNCDAVSCEKWLSFSFSTKHQRSEWSRSALWSNMSLMEPKHTWLLTNLQLLLYHVPWFSFYDSLFPSHRLFCCTPLDCKKNTGQFKAVEVCASTLSFSIPSIDCLVSRHNYLPYVAMATRKSISPMLWTHCTLTAPKIFLLIGFDWLFCFSLSTPDLVSVILCFFLSREELELCRQNIESLVDQRDDLEKEIEQQKAADNGWVQN